MIIQHHMNTCVRNMIYLLTGSIRKFNGCDKDESELSCIDAFARHTLLRQTGFGMGGERIIRL